jgi:beta-N-acetylhexosaminidase
MNSRRREWGLALVLVFVTSTLALAQPGPTGWTDWTDSAPAEILAQLSLEEKVGQLFIIYHGPPAFMAEHGFGGSLIFTSMVRKPDELKASLVEAQKLCRIPLLVAIDQEGGEINRLNPLPGLEAVPSAREMAAMSPGEITTAMQTSAQAMTDLGINLNLAPVVDPALDDRGEPTLMGQRDRAFASSIEDILPPARTFMTAFAEHDIGCILKHFPGYDVPENSDHELAASGSSQELIESRQEAFAQTMPRAAGVMMSSIRFTAVSEAPAVLDPSWVSQARCGFGGRLVMTDDLWGGALRAWVSGTTTVDPRDYPPEDLRRLVLLAFDAGNDMLMVTYPAKAVQMKGVLVEEIAADPARQAQLDEAVLRILQVKSDLGLFTR